MKIDPRPNPKRLPNKGGGPGKPAHPVRRAKPPALWADQTGSAPRRLPRVKKIPKP
jgi:hypothetical protein